MTTSASAFSPGEKGVMRHAYPTTLGCPLCPHGDFTVSIVSAEATAWPSLQRVQPPGERRGLAVARLTAAADVPSAFHRGPAVAE